MTVINIFSMTDSNYKNSQLPVFYFELSLTTPSRMFLKRYIIFIFISLYLFI